MVPITKSFIMRTSQFGQAEYILSRLEDLGIRNGTCFEAGASSPEYISNSKPFIAKGWKAYLVERDQHNCEKWESLQLNNVSIFNAAIPYKKDGLKYIFDNHMIPYDIDVMFLDIDGGEYQLLDQFINHTYQPKVICVEYDNSFPLSINCVPSEICHGRQASSMSFYKLMSSAGYVYVNTFCHDHIFLSESFAKKMGINPPPFEFFCATATNNLYQFDNVFLGQKPDQADLGVNFYEEKIKMLISECHPHAVNFYSYVVGGLSCCYNFICKQGQENSDYSQTFARAACEFRAKYSYLLTAPLT